MTSPQRTTSDVVGAVVEEPAQQAAVSEFLSYHVSMTALQWSNGWAVTADLWRHSADGLRGLQADEARRTYTVHWPELSPMSRADVAQLLWRSALMMARRADDKPALSVPLTYTPRLPGETRWIKGTAHLVGGSRSTELLAYLTGKGHTSKNPVESRLCKHDLLTMVPLPVPALLHTLGLLLEQHCA